MVAPAPDTSRVQLKKKHVCRRQTKSFTPLSTPLPTQKMHLESLRLNTFKYMNVPLLSQTLFSLTRAL